MDAAETAKIRLIKRENDALAWLDDLEDDDEWPDLASWEKDPTPPTALPVGRPSALKWVLEVPRPSLARCLFLADSLPFHAPAMYERDRNGTWRYAWRARVPRAMDLTPARLVQPRRHDDVVAIPAWSTKTALEPLVEESVSEGLWTFVDAELWTTVANRSIGIWACELQTQYMLDLDAIAARLHCRPATARSMHARKQLPPAQHRAGRTPLWSEPVVEHWMANR
jgi:hypothetical protein